MFGVAATRAAGSMARRATSPTSLRLRLERRSAAGVRQVEAARHATMRKRWTRTASPRRKPPVFFSDYSNPRVAGCTPAHAHAQLCNAMHYETAGAIRTAVARGPILTEQHRTAFVPLKKYGTAENSTPHAKDDYNQRFTFVSSWRHAPTPTRTRANTPSYKMHSRAGASSCRTRGS